MGEIKLLGSYASPFAIRVQIALDLKSLRYELIEETFVPKSDLLLKSNPIHKKIPIFFHNDKLICESNVIVQYIDESFPYEPSILPTDPYERAIIRFWAAYVDNKWYDSLREIFFGKTPEAKAKATDETIEGIAVLEEAFVKLSNGKPFFGGDKIGFVDIAFGSTLALMRAANKLYGITLLDEAKSPSLSAWAVKFCAHDAVKNNMPESDKVVEFAKMITRYTTKQH